MKQLVVALLMTMLVAGCGGVSDGRQTSDAVAPPSGARDEGAGGEAEEQVDSYLEEATVRVRNTTCAGVGVGTGFLIDDRRIVTNRHVVDGAVEVDVNLWDGRTVQARVIGALRNGDVAFVELAEPVPAPLELDEREQDVDAEVTVIGFPEGGEFTRTTGTIIDREDVEGVDMYRITNRVRPGNSGGPLLSADGDVVGIVTLLDTERDEGLAIAIDELDRLTESGTEDVDPCEYTYQ